MDKETVRAGQFGACLLWLGGGLGCTAEVHKANGGQ